MTVGVSHSLGRALPRSRKRGLRNSPKIHAGTRNLDCHFR
jgi:hypothetical protein